MSGSISLSALHALRNGEAETRLLMLGPKSSGKTSLLSALAGRQIEPMGNQKFRIRNLVKDGINITAWDVGGESYVDAYWFDHHSDLVCGLIYVVDSTSTAVQLAEAKQELFQILSHPKLDRVPLLVMCNKGDLADAQSVVKLSEALELHEVKRNAHKSVRTNATTTQDGIQQGLEWLLTQRFSRA